MTTGATGQKGYGCLPLFLLLAAAVILVYSPVFKAGYTNWDDPPYTYENASVQSVSAANLKTIFCSFKNSQYYPASELSFLAENALFGENAAVHHSVNLILHCLNAWLVFTFLYAFSKKRGLAFAAACLWALHPANVESVAWIAERKQVLYAFFYLSALMLYMRNLESGGRRTYLAALGLCLASLASKPAAVTLPLALLLLEARHGNNGLMKITRRTAPFFACAALFTAIAVWGQTSGGNILPAKAVALFSFYILKVIAPAGLSAVYPYWEMLAVFKADAALYTLPALAFAAALIFAYQRNKPAAWGLAWFALHILPHVSLLTIGNMIAADRFLYLPAIGLIYALSEAAAAVATSARAKTAGLALAAALLIFSGATTFKRAGVWTSSLTLWTDTLEKFPLEPVANMNMAEALIKAGRPAEAEDHYLTVLRTDPVNRDALYNLGTLYARGGRYAAALPLLKSALAVFPENAQGWNNLGLVQRNLDHRAEARKAFLMATAVKPDYAQAYANLADLETLSGDCVAATNHFLQARRLGSPAAPPKSCGTGGKRGVRTH